MAREYIEPMQLSHALATHVLAVAAPKDWDPKLWGVYIDAVPGKCHKREEAAVLATGVKVRKDIAVALFSQFDPRHYCF